MDDNVMTYVEPSTRLGLDKELPPALDVLTHICSLLPICSRTRMILPGRILLIRNSYKNSASLKE